MNPEIEIYKNLDELTQKFAHKFKSIVDKRNNKRKVANIIVSGNIIPKELYITIGKSFTHKIDWQMVHFFWGDEKCMDSDQINTNFGWVNEYFLKYISIPMHNIHPIVGDNHPFLEADRYSTVLHEHFNIIREIPVFDMVILGLEPDGHIASIYSDQINLFSSNRLYEVITHPVTGKCAITATGKILNHAKNIFITATGEDKAEILHTILSKKNNYKDFSAANIFPSNGKITWLIDKKAAKYL